MDRNNLTPPIRPTTPMPESTPTVAVASMPTNKELQSMPVVSTAKSETKSVPIMRSVPVARSTPMTHSAPMSRSAPAMRPALQSSIMDTVKDPRTMANNVPKLETDNKGKDINAIATAFETPKPQPSRWDKVKNFFKQFGQKFKDWRSSKNGTKTTTDKSKEDIKKETTQSQELQTKKAQPTVSQENAISPQPKEKPAIEAQQNTKVEKQIEKESEAKESEDKESEKKESDKKESNDRQSAKEAEELTIKKLLQEIIELFQKILSHSQGIGDVKDKTQEENIDKDKQITQDREQDTEQKSEQEPGKTDEPDQNEADTKSMLDSVTSSLKAVTAAIEKNDPKELDKILQDLKKIVATLEEQGKDKQKNEKDSKETEKEAEAPLQAGDKEEGQTNSKEEIKDNTQEAVQEGQQEKVQQDETIPVTPLPSEASLEDELQSQYSEVHEFNSQDEEDIKLAPTEAKEVRAEEETKQAPSIDTQTLHQQNNPEIKSTSTGRSI